MPRKPVPGLPDVFAKPGGAPSRGTPIEDLPTFADDSAAHGARPGEPIAEPTAPTSAALSDAPPHPAASPLVALPPVATPPAAQSSAAHSSAAQSSAAQSSTILPPAAPPPAAQPAAAHSSAAPPELPPLSQHPVSPAHNASPAAAKTSLGKAPDNAPARASAAKPAHGGVSVIVWVLLAASLTAPLWERQVLSGLGIHTQSARSAAENATALAQQGARLAMLEQRLASTTTQLDALRADLALTSLRATEATTQARAVALLRLRDALRAATPFGIELAVLHATGGDTGKLQTALAQLAPYATTGAPSLDQLQREFRILNDSVARAFRQANPGSWMDFINLSRLGGASPPAQLDPNVRAAQLGLSRLAVGDVPGAIEQASQVDGAYQTDFADWVAEAKGRLAADTALREIDNLITHPASTP